MRELFIDLFSVLNLSFLNTPMILSAVLFCVLLVLTVIVYALMLFVINVILKHAIVRSKFKWDDIVFESGLFRKIGLIVPLLFLAYNFPLFFPDKEILLDIAEKVLTVSVVLLITNAIAITLDTINSIYIRFNPEVAKKKPVKGYLQMVKIFIYIIAIVLVVTEIAGVSPIGILSGLGAMSAVLMLVFKDPIMGVVSSIQLSSNDLVRIGDWIEMPKYGADGEVLDVTLQSVIVRNWDMTVTSIPIYALVSDSFKNWRGMSESPGRRVKKSIHIDMSSVRFLTEEDIQRLSSVLLLKDYLEQKVRELQLYNTEKNISQDDVVSSRRLTNLGTFRTYVSKYLESLDWVESSLTHMVRYLQPTEKGIALEIYFFSSNKSWVEYEQLQADVFDHLLAILHAFDLRVYQSPTGWDITRAVDIVKK